MQILDNRHPEYIHPAIVEIEDKIHFLLITKAPDNKDNLLTNGNPGPQLQLNLRPDLTVPNL